MRASFAAIAAIALSAAIAACGSSPAATSTPGATLAPGATATPAGATQAPTGAPTAVPTPAGGTQPPTGLTGHECDAVPTFSMDNPAPPTSPPDTALLAHFPAEIDGQPLTDVHTGSWVYDWCSLGGQALLNQSFGQSPNASALLALTTGRAKAMVDGEIVELNAFRSPGTQMTASGYMQYVTAFVGPTASLPNLSTVTIAGKTVWTGTDEDGEKGYAYPSGDTLIFFDNVTDSQAAKIIAALP